MTLPDIDRQRIGANVQEAVNRLSDLVAYIGDAIQSGRVTLVNGVSAFTPANVTSDSAGVASLVAFNASTQVGEMQFEFTEGESGVGGGFVLTSMGPRRGDGRPVHLRVDRDATMTATSEGTG